MSTLAGGSSFVQESNHVLFPTKLNLWKCLLHILNFTLEKKGNLQSYICK